MNLKKLFLAIAVAVVLSSGMCFGYDTDFENRSTLDIFLGLNKDWDFEFQEELRFNDNGGTLYYDFSDFGLTYKGLVDWLELGFNFRKIYERESHNDWVEENRPHLNLTFKGKLAGFDISDNSRIEYRDREEKKDEWRYRNKLTAKFPIELTSLKLRPYVADEIFVNLYGEGITRNRLFSGFSFKVAENTKLDIFYLWQASKSGEQWDDVHALGTKLTLSF